jgi:hypothetical protein
VSAANSSPVRSKNASEAPFPPWPNKRSDTHEDVPWSAVIEAALEVRGRLEELGLHSFVKTSGGKGLHVVLPLEPLTGWDDAKKFTQTIAEAMAKARPERYAATMAKAARRGRIFIDYLRNGRGATAVSAYAQGLSVGSSSRPITTSWVICAFCPGAAELRTGRVWEAIRNWRLSQPVR